LIQNIFAKELRCSGNCNFKGEELKDRQRQKARVVQALLKALWEELLRKRDALRSTVNEMIAKA